MNSPATEANWMHVVAVVVDWKRQAMSAALETEVVSAGPLELAAVLVDRQRYAVQKVPLNTHAPLLIVAALLMSMLLNIWCEPELANCPDVNVNDGMSV